MAHINSSFIQTQISNILFAWILLILLNFVGQGQSLQCFECKGTLKPICQQDHPGILVPCPATEDGTGGWDCGILRTEYHANGRFEVTKGCFDFNEEFRRYSLEHRKRVVPKGDCLVLEEDQLVHTEMQSIAVCRCSSDGCNKKEINGIGLEDVEQREMLRRSGTCGTLRESVLALSLTISLVALELLNQLNVLQ